MSVLPKGWTSEKLIKLADRITKGTTPTSYGYKYQSEGVAFVKVENIRDGYIDRKSIKHFISEEANLNQKRSILESGDILFSIAGTIGTTCLIRDCDLPSNTNQALAIIRGTSNVLLPLFLRFQLESEVARKQSDDSKRGGAMNNISLENIGNFDILIPPLNEQKRIVEKLEKLIGKVEAVQGRLEKIPAILKRFRQAVLAAACTGKLTTDWRKSNEIDIKTELPLDWNIQAVKDVIEDLKYGTSQKCNYEKNGVPVLRIPNIGDWYIDQTDLKFTELSNNEYSKLKLREGDLLLIRSNGSVSLIGKTAIVQKSEVNYAFAGYLIRLRPDCNQIYPQFLNFVLASYNVRLQIEVPARSTSGVNNINNDEVRALKIPIPPLEEQKEIVRRVEELFKFADQIEARYKKARAYTDRLAQSILAKAFRGELVPQDERDEPASRLLERIRQEKSSAPPKNQKAKRKAVNQTNLFE